MLVLQISDFSVGKYKIPQAKGVCEGQLQAYINRYEKRYLIDLLGCELSELFIDDLTDGVPTDPIYLALFNEICIDLRTGFFNSYYWAPDLCYCQPKRIISRGIKEMLKGFIFFQYMRDFPNQKDITGITHIDSENSTMVDFAQWGIAEFYNESIEDYNNIQYFIYEDKDTYDVFNGVSKKKIGLI